MIYGYARVSTAGQSTAAQVAELRAAGCEKVVSETASGARRRPRLDRLVKSLGKGDVLVVTRLDRIARTSLGLLQVLQQVTDHGAAFRSLVEHWADTSSAHGRLLMSVLAGHAEFERDMLLARTSEGRAAAVARGVKLGRKHALSDVQRAWVAVQKREGTTSLDLSRLFGVHRTTISRIPPAAPDVKAPPAPHFIPERNDSRRKARS
jgi:DNA invertase Pin-like site-specific DNA recombinase